MTQRVDFGSATQNLFMRIGFGFSYTQRMTQAEMLIGRCMRSGVVEIIYFPPNKTIGGNQSGKPCLGIRKVRQNHSTNYPKEQREKANPKEMVLGCR